MFDFLFYFSLFCFGVSFGSFSTVLISRWKNGQGGILTGRSMCPKCQHTLGWTELVPVFSWLFQKGKCKHCSASIPKKYPIIEIIMGGSFVLTGYIFHNFSTENYIFLLSLLFLVFITVIYILYDIFYLEIPEEIYILWVVYFFILFILSSFFGFDKVFFNYFQFNNSSLFIYDKIFGIFVLYSFLFLQILIPGIIFLIQNKRKKEIGELFLLYFIFPFITIYDFIKYKILKKPLPKIEENDIPTWVGIGDLFLAIIIGGTIGVIHGIVAFFFAYFIGSIVGICMVIFHKKHPNSQQNRTEIPFGPFLGIGFLLVLTFYHQIQQFIENYFFFPL